MSDRTGKKKKPKRRRGSVRKYTLYYVLVFLVIALVGITLSLTVFFKIENIGVTGNTVYKDADLIETTGIQAGDNLLRMRPRRLARILREQYPYIESAEIHRSLPDTVTIRVKIAEERAVLRDASTGKYAVLSREGRALRAGLPACPVSLIEADGFSVAADAGTDEEGNLLTEPLAEGGILTSAEKARFAALLEILDALDSEGLSGDIDVIDLRDMLEIRLLYRGRVSVLLGSSEDLEYKIRFAKACIGKEVTDGTVGSLDVSRKPTARLRQYDIYRADTWPFAPDLLPEYERKIEKDGDLPDAPEEGGGTAGGEGETSYSPPAQQPQTSSSAAPQAPAASSEAPPASQEAPPQEPPKEPSAPLAPEKPRQEEPSSEDDGELIVVEEESSEEEEVIYLG